MKGYLGVGSRLGLSHRSGLMDDDDPKVYKIRKRSIQRHYTGNISCEPINKSVKPTKMKTRCTNRWVFCKFGLERFYSSSLKKPLDVKHTSKV
jgi:hypothetical protein